jgi:hypothetical protein
MASLIASTSVAIAIAPTASAAPNCAAFDDAVQYRVNPTSSTGLLTSSQSAGDTAAGIGYTENRGEVFRASIQRDSTLSVVHRLYKSSSKDYMFLTGATEITKAKQAGYVNYGSTFSASTTAATCLVPVYRYLRSGRHQYAVTATARSALISAGWSLEGPSFYAAAARVTPVPTPTPTATPQTVVTVGKVASTAVEVKWTAVLGSTGYLVRRDGAGGSSPWSTTDPATARSRTFLYLKTGIEYTFTVTPQPGGVPVSVKATPGGSTPTPTPTATTTITPTPTPTATQPPAPTGLPQLGFSVNSEALSGPIQQAHYNNLAGIGSRWIRTGFAPGNFAPTADRYFAAATASGQNVLLRGSLPDRQYSGAEPVNVGAYGDHLAALATRYQGKGPGGANPVIELPNELNGRVSGATYAAMACNAYRKVKAVDPSFKVIGASENVYASGWATWLEEVYKGGYVNCSDGISWHNYDPPSDQSKWNTLRNLHTKYGALGEDVWLTEFGATTCPNVTGSSLGCQTEQGQANRITAVLKDLAANKRYVTHALGYVDENVPSRQSTDPFEANFGIYKNDGKGNITGAKAAVAAIKALYRP